mmetsp:Transcript_5266/g.33094  ORF Transcript_5266/g.33094 Transcript_5266/m.33094 type:complete len:86 (-) Transcript_5266:2742-2999(-)
MASLCFEANIRVKGRGWRTTLLYVDLCWEIDLLLIQSYFSADISSVFKLVMRVFWHLCVLSLECLTGWVDGSCIEAWANVVYARC